MKNDKGRIAVGLSGGVDSSVTAALLKKAGYDVVGITMEIFDDAVALKESSKHACFGPGEKEDVEKAASLCKKISIPFHTIDLRDEYRDHVISYFKQEYLSGRTPNPCVVCNQKLKFGFLLEKAKNAGIDFEIFATGHYARIETSERRPLLKRASDLSKDQSYFLYALTPEQLSRTRFPIGHYKKQRVRQMARSMGLETADSPESQDFIAGGDYAPLFAEGEIKEGDVVDEDGKVLGRHRGIIHYTIGQRRGLGIAAPSPLYVSKIDAGNNRIIVSSTKNQCSQGLIASDFNLLAVEKLDRPYSVKAKIRLTHKETDATVFPHGKNRARIAFGKPQTAVTPGQSVVLYSGDVVFGGGIIEQAL